MNSNSERSSAVNCAEKICACRTILALSISTLPLGLGFCPNQTPLLRLYRRQLHLTSRASVFLRLNDRREAAESRVSVDLPSVAWDSADRRSGGPVEFGTDHQCAQPTHRHSQSLTRGLDFPDRHTAEQYGGCASSVSICFIPILYAVCGKSSRGVTVPTEPHMPPVLSMPMPASTHMLTICMEMINYTPTVLLQGEA